MELLPQLTKSSIVDVVYYVLLLNPNCLINDKALTVDVVPQIEEK